MKKLFLLLGSALVLSACTMPGAATPAATPTPTPQDTTSQTSNTNPIAAALQAGQSAQCQVTKKDGSASMTYLVKGKKIKMTGTTTQANQKVTNMISDGQTVYTWSGGDTKGIKMQVPSTEDLKNLAQQVGQTVPDFSKSDSQSTFENLGYNVDCKVEAVSDDEFTPPANITFTDTAAMMQKATQTLNSATSGMSQEQQDAIKQQTQQMMQKYGQ